LTLAGVADLIAKYTVVPARTSNEYTLDGVAQADETVVFLLVYEPPPFVLYPTSIAVAPIELLVDA